MHSQHTTAPTRTVVGHIDHHVAQARVDVQVPRPRLQARSLDKIARRLAVEPVHAAVLIKHKQLYFRIGVRVHSHQSRCTPRAIAQVTAREAWVWYEGL